MREKCNHEDCLRDGVRPDCWSYREEKTKKDKWSKKRKRPRNKYDWEKLKTEFMNAPELETSTFFRNRYGFFSCHMRKSSAWWTREKKERKKRIAEKALKKAEDQEAKNLFRSLQNVRAFFQQRVRSQEDLDRLTIKDAKRIWEILRTENNLPTRILKTDNTHHNIDEDLIFLELENDGGNKEKDFSKNQNFDKKTNL